MIRLIAPFIRPIPPFIILSIELITPLRPDLTAPLIAFAILVPIAENLSLILSHNPPQKLPHSLNLFLIAVHALPKIFPNHSAAGEKRFFIAYIKVI